MAERKGDVHNEWAEKYSGKSIAELGRMFIEQKKELDELRQTKKIKDAEFDFLRLSVIPDAMEEQEMSSINIRGVGRLGLTMDAHVTVLAENRDDFYGWLEDNGHGGMVKPYAQPGTIKAWAKDMAKRDAEGEDGCELPEDLIKVDPFYRASVTKA